MSAEAAVSAEAAEEAAEEAAAEAAEEAAAVAAGRLLRLRVPDKIRCFARKELFENLGAKKDLGWVLVVTERHHVGVIRVFQLGLDVFDLVLLHEEKIAVDVCRHVSSFVIADAIEIAQNPRKRINAGANQVAGQMVVGEVLLCQL